MQVTILYHYGLMADYGRPPCLSACLPACLPAYLPDPAPAHGRKEIMMLTIRQSGVTRSVLIKFFAPNLALVSFCHLDEC